MKKTTIELSKEAIKELLSALSEHNARAADVIISRYGLRSGVKQTLEEIGQQYDITRERVRQIENFALNFLRGVETHTIFLAVEELKKEVVSLGYLVSKELLNNLFEENKVGLKHISFIFWLKEKDFIFISQNEKFKEYWTTANDQVSIIQKALTNLVALIDERDTLDEERIIDIFRGYLGELATSAFDTTIMNWISLSTEIGKNALGEWGKISSSLISQKGIIDRAYVVLRKHGTPLHFSEIAQAIESTFKEKTNVASTHNELIKDGRFVLVGRGRYALAEWGYSKGTTVDVIQEILSRYPHGLRKAEIVVKVLEKRFVKENTILVNLANKKLFSKIDGEWYHLSKQDN